MRKNAVECRQVPISRVGADAPRPLDSACVAVLHLDVNPGLKFQAWSVESSLSRPVGASAGFIKVSVCLEF
jgi:hypothetical protein